MLKNNASSFDVGSITKNQAYIIGGILLFLMVVTRVGFVNHIQDASWAVFFILGFYVRAKIALPLFLLTVFVVDITGIMAKGGENFCFTISYPFLAPAYGSMWLAGRLFANNYSESIKGLAYFVLAAIVGITACDIISSGGFYWFSGRFEETTFAEFAGRIAKYLPMYMKTAVIYLAVTAVVHFAMLQILKVDSKVRTS